MNISLKVLFYMSSGNVYNKIKTSATFMSWKKQKDNTMRWEKKTAQEIKKQWFIGINF